MGQGTWDMGHGSWNNARLSDYEPTLEQKLNGWVRTSISPQTPNLGFQREYGEKKILFPKRRKRNFQKNQDPRGEGNVEARYPPKTKT